MKLLLLTPQFPYPPHQGTTIRNFNLIKGLAQRHEIDLLTFGSPQELADSPLVACCRRIELAAPPTRSTARRALETFLSPRPDMARRLDSPGLARTFARLVRENRYDVVQLEGIEMSPSWLSMPQGGRPPFSIVLDDHNAEYVLQRSAFEADRQLPRRWPGALYSDIQWRKLARYERDLCLRVTHVVAVSEPDARALSALDPRILPTVIPNGVDVKYYAPSDAVSSNPLSDAGLVFTGKMDFRPNVDAAIWFAREILPLLRRQHPRAHVAFVGQQPGPRVRALAALPGVEITGTVPDTRPYVADAAVFVVPLRMGGGTRLKVLEAMAMGRAIVSTRLGAAGIEYAPERDLVIADTAEEFASAVAALLRNPERRRALGASARKLAEEKYDWSKIVPRFEALYGIGGIMSG